jgi:hypothetical protein
VSFAPTGASSSKKIRPVLAIAQMLKRRPPEKVSLVQIEIEKKLMPRL